MTAISAKAPTTLPTRIRRLAILSVAGVVLLAGCTSPGTDASSASPSTGSAATGSDASASATAGTPIDRALLRSWAPTAFQADAGGLVTSESASSWDAQIDYVTSLPWRYYSAGGVEQAAACVGTGKPTVLISNGLSEADHIGASAWVWSAFVQAASKIKRVCLLDRAGTGLSMARPADAQPNGPLANSSEMLALMRAMGESGPYVAVGWSYGGLVALAAAATSPEEIAGLVLVDPPGPAAYRTYDKGEYWEAGSQLDMAGAEEAFKALPVTSPVVILKAAKYPPEVSKAFRRAWTAALKSLSQEVSPDSLYATVTNSQHAIPIQNPRAIIAALQIVLTSIADGSDLRCTAALQDSSVDC